MSGTDPDLVLSGVELLDAVTDVVVAFHVRYYHRVPSSARSRLLGPDLLACTLRGIYTDVEKTMIELSQQRVVHETRGSFEAAMQHRLTEAVERLSGRKVTSFFTHHHVGPDLAVELFLLEPVSGPAGTP